MFTLAKTAGISCCLLLVPQLGCRRLVKDPVSETPQVRKQAVALANGTQLQLQQRPPVTLSQDSPIAMFPRVLAGPGVSEAAAAKINASLDRFNAEVLADARECHKDVRQTLHKGDVDNWNWERDIDVTLRGPHYLSLLAVDSSMCDGPHPLDDEIALTYDLTTGSPVNWMSLLPKEATGKVVRSPHRLPIGFVRWPAMVQRTNEISQKDPEHEGADCTQVYIDPEMNINVWLDGKAHAVVFAPLVGMHYDNAMCSESVSVRADEAARMGFAPELVAALRAAQEP